MKTTQETIPGTKAFGERLGQCDLNFVALLADIASISKEAAFKVFGAYGKAKVIKIDACNQTWNVKHGAYLEKENILHVLSNL